MNNMDLLSDQPIQNGDSPVDVVSSSNGQPLLWKTPSEENLKSPGDINANMEENGDSQTGNLVDFGDMDTLDVKMVVAPPPEFDNNFDFLMGTAETDNTNNSLISTGPDQSNGDVLAFLNTPQNVEVQEQQNKETTRGRTPSDLDAFLNELGDGTTIDEEEDALMYSADDQNVLEQDAGVPEKLELNCSLNELSNLDGKSAGTTDEADEETVVESSVVVQESVPEQSSNVNGLLSTSSDAGEDNSSASITTTNEDLKDLKIATENADHNKPKISRASIKLDLSAKRRSFFGDGDTKSDSLFQPQISDIPSATSPSSVNLSSTLPTVHVLPKVLTTYQRPESIYESKPRAATDSFVSSHALLGLGGNQVVLSDTKPRSVSEPPPSSNISTAEEVALLRKNDPSVTAKSTKFIQAMYGPKPGTKSSELVNEDGKTLFEYEKERLDVLDAMKVKRKKKIVSWQRDSQSEDLTSPESEEPLSPFEMSNGKTETQVLSPRTSSSLQSESTALSAASKPSLTVEPEPSDPVIPEVEKPLQFSKDLVTESEPERAHLDTAFHNVKPNAVVESPIPTIDKEKETAPLVHSINAKDSETLPNTEVQNSCPVDSKEEAVPIDLMKMRNIWEQKVSTETEAEKQKCKKIQPRKMFSFEAKAKEAACKEEKLRKEKAAQAKLVEEIPVAEVEPDFMGTMPKDPDDEFDRSESYSYDVTPQRKVEIQSHWANSEGVIERDMRLQKEREKELLQQGLLKSQTDEVAVVKVDKQNIDEPVRKDETLKVRESIVEREIRLQKERDENDAQERQRIWQMAANRQSSFESPSEKSVPQLSKIPMQQKDNVAPVKPTECEISPQKVQVQEQTPQQLLMSGNTDLTVIIKEKENKPSNEAVVKEEKVSVTESIVQREIRLQRERDEENALERQKALQETRARSASVESPLSSSGRSIPQSPIKQSAEPVTPIKPASPQVGPKTPENPPSLTSKTPDKSPTVRFGLHTMNSDPYNSYREYQKMLRGRKTNEKSSEKAGPMKATEGGVSGGQLPMTLKERPTKQPAEQRPSSPLLTRPPSPLIQRPGSPGFNQVPSHAIKPEEPSAEDITDCSLSIAETPVQREIRLAREREAQQQGEHSVPRRGTNPLKAVHTLASSLAIDTDIPDVVLVERAQVTESSQGPDRSQVTEPMTSPWKDDVIMRRKETPVERDIRLAEERETMLRKERDATLSPVKKIRGPQSESLIEQEIRQQKEKEQEYRREKGLLMSPPPSPAGETTDGVSQRVTDGGKQGAITKEQAGSPTASKEVPPPKYRPQRRSLVLAQQWEQMFK